MQGCLSKARLWRGGFGIIFSISLSACTIVHQPLSVDNNDPLENLNRKVFAFNHAVDDVVVRPVATAYKYYVPSPIKKLVKNVFSNFEDVSNIANEILQLKTHAAASDMWRVIINTTVGVGGIFDLASRANIPKHHQDFGLTLTYWGMKPRFYFVLPLLGPRSLDGLFGVYVDNTLLSPVHYLDNDGQKIGLRSLKLVDIRGDYLDVEKIIYKAVDPYAMERDFYLNNRIRRINQNVGFDGADHLKDKKSKTDDDFLFGDDNAMPEDVAVNKDEKSKDTTENPQDVDSIPDQVVTADKTTVNKRNEQDMTSNNAIKPNKIPNNANSKDQIINTENAIK